MNTPTPHLEHLNPALLTTDQNVRADLRLDKPFLASIKQNGVLEPIVAYPDTDNPNAYRVHIGHRRHAAAVEAGLDSGPVYIIGPRDAQDRIVEQLVENLHRDALTPLEQATAFKQLQLEGMPAINIAKRTSTKLSHVGDAIKTVENPAAAKLLEEHQIDLAQAATIAEFADDPKALALLARIAIEEPGQLAHAVQQEREERAQKQAHAACMTAIAQAGHINKTTEQPRWDDPEWHRLERVYIAPGHETALTIELALAASPADVLAYPHLVSNWDEAPEYEIEYSVRNLAAHGWHLYGNGPTVKTAATEEEKAEARRLREQNKLWHSATIVRIEWLQQFLQGNQLPDGALDWAARHFTSLPNGYNNATTDKIHALLNTPRPPEKTYWGSETAGNALPSLAVGRRTPHVLLAIALGVIEGAPEFDKKGWSHTVSRDYLITLQGWGYDASPLEQQVIDGKAK